MNTSSLTLQNVKDRLVRDLSDNRITDQDVIDAINDFYSIVHRLERQHFPHKGLLQSAALLVGSSGYDLTQLTDIGTTDRLRVFLSERKSQKLLGRFLPGSRERGYYIVGDTLYLLPEPSSNETVYVDYYKKTTRVADSTTLSSHTLQIDQDLERALRLYLKHSFFDGEYQYGLRDDAETRAIEEMERYFFVGDSLHLV